jgi:hypothetical protein
MLELIISLCANSPKAVGSPMRVGLVRVVAAAHELLSGPFLVYLPGRKDFVGFEEILASAALNSEGLNPFAASTRPPHNTNSHETLTACPGMLFQ